jgi:hypothetical protein
MSCVHLHPKTKRDGKPSTCAAFPEGIPLEIMRGDVRHDKPIEGDHGIQYEKRSDW